ncbi:MAG: hypothetical protein IJW32_04795 [Clostridia bacterium]|nr:hypothetical protein [Clostridia bacterium]
MKKSRLFAIIAVFVVVVFIFLLSSPFFTLTKVEIGFVDSNNKQVSLLKNQKINSQQKINNIIESANFEYGKSIFLLDKNKYTFCLENKNPYLKIVNVSTVFPNKLYYFAQERTPFYFFLVDNDCYVLDTEFKLLEIFDKKDINTNNYVCFNFFKYSQKIDFFNFFNLSKLALTEGDFLCENNLLFSSVKNIYPLLKNFFYDKEVYCIFEEINVIEVSSGVINLELKTHKNNYGVTLLVEDSLLNFEKKFNKILRAFTTLLVKEPIKTTYGVLKINNSFNCFWNNL